MTTVGPYRLISLLGSGGMGSVYCAEHQESQRLVALKQAKDNPFAVQTVRNEARALARLDHPGIVDLVDHDLSGSRPWLAMELIRGKPLSDLLRPEGEATQPVGADVDTADMESIGAAETSVAEIPVPPAAGKAPPREPDDDPAEIPDDSPGKKPDGEIVDPTPWWTTQLLDPALTAPLGPAAASNQKARAQNIFRLRNVAEGALDELLDILVDLCDALAYLHGEGLVHCDLKPENIVVRESGQPVLIDFGLVCPPPGRDGREVLMRERLEACTPYYIAPERIQEQDWDARADLYALGCIFFETLAGYPPFQGGRHAVMEKHVAEEPPLEVRPGAHDFIALIAELLEKSPYERLPYARDVSLRLRRLRVQGEGRGGAASPASKRATERADASENQPERTSGADPASTSQPAAEHENADDGGDLRTEEAITEERKPAHAADASARNAPPGRSPCYLYRPRFTGRPELIEGLREYLDNRDERAGTLVFIAGESGCGKTRSLNEVVRVYQQHRDRVLVLGECTPPTSDERRVGGGALHPFRGFLREVAERCQVRKAYAESLGEHPRVLSAVLPELALVPGLRDDPLPVLSPDAARDRLLEAMTDTMVVHRGTRKMMLFIDDLQWADDLTLELCARIASSRPDDEWRDIILVGAYRQDEVGGRLRDILERHAPRVFSLSLLARDDLAAMVRDMLATASPPEDLVEFMLARSGGNPFFLSEYMLVAHQRGWLRRRADGWLFQGPEDKLLMPERVHDLVHTRLRNLSEGAHRLVQVLAVFGRETSYEAMALVGEALDVDWLVHSGDLLAVQVLEERPDGVRFQHDLLREETYRSLDDENRRGLHRVVASTLETLQARPGSNISHRELAHHWHAANERERALEHLDAAALEALRSGAEREAYSLLEQALDLSKAVPEVEDLRRGRWHRQMAELCHALGELDESREHVQHSMKLLHSGLPSSSAGWAWRCTRETLVHLWRRFTGRGTGPARDKRAHERGDELVECSLSMRSYVQTGYYSRPPLEVFTSMLLAVNLAEASGEHVDVASNYAIIGYVLGLLGMRATAERYFAHAHDIGKEYKDHGDYLLAITTQALHHLCRAEWPQAEDTVHELAELAESVHDQHNIGVARTFEAHTAYYQGRFKTSLSRFAELRQLARKRNSEQHQAWGLYGMARGLIPLGRLSQAIEYAERARDMLEYSVDESSKIICRGLLATAYQRSGQSEQAWREALAARAKLRGVPLVFSILEAMVGIVEVVLTRLAERRARGEDIREERRMAAREMARLRKFSKRFRFAVPHTLLLLGEYQRIVKSSLERARRHWREAATRAESMAMDYQLALANLALARNALLVAEGPGGDAAPASEEAAEARERAIELLSRMGCMYHLALLEPELALAGTSDSDTWNLSLHGHTPPALTAADPPPPGEPDDEPDDEPADRPADRPADEPADGPAHEPAD